MPDFPVIPASDTTPVEITTQVVTTQTDTKTYDRWWIERFRVPAPDPNAPVNAVAVITKGRKDENGVWELSPRPEDKKEIVIEDIFTLAMSDPEVAAVMGGLLQIVARIGAEKGLL